MSRFTPTVSFRSSLCRGSTVPDLGVLNYEVEGSGAPAFALMHGWCSNLRHWDRQVEFFAPRHTIVRRDRRGMGQSAPKPAASPSDHADDLARVMDAAGIEKAIVMGHAGGGPGRSISRRAIRAARWP